MNIHGYNRATCATRAGAHGSHSSIEGTIRKASGIARSEFEAPVQVCSRSDAEPQGAGSFSQNNLIERASDSRSPQLNNEFFAQLTGTELLQLGDEAQTLIEDRGPELGADGRATFFATVIGTIDELRSPGRPPHIRNVTRWLVERLWESIEHEPHRPLAEAVWLLSQDLGFNPVDRCRAARVPVAQMCERLRDAAAVGSDSAAPKLSWSLGFAHPDVTLKDLLRPDGELALFRVIKGAYVPGHSSGTYTAVEGDYSYSVNPYIPEFWRDYLDAEASAGDFTVLISFQRPTETRLVSPVDPHHPWRPAETILEACEVLQAPSLDTPVGQLSSLRELKVPIADERVRYAIPLEKYLKVAARFRGRPFELSAFLDGLQAIV